MRGRIPLGDRRFCQLLTQPVDRYSPLLIAHLVIGFVCGRHFLIANDLVDLTPMTQALAGEKVWIEGVYTEIAFLNVWSVARQTLRLE